MRGVSFSQLLTDAAAQVDCNAVVLFIFRIHSKNRRCTAMSDTLLIANSGRLTREQLALVPTPPGTATHKPIPHMEVINGLIETLGFRHIAVVKDEYAVSTDGMKMFGVMELDQGM